MLDVTRPETFYWKKHTIEQIAIIAQTVLPQPGESGLHFSALKSFFIHDFCFYYYCIIAMYALLNVMNKTEWNGLESMIRRSDSFDSV